VSRQPPGCGVGAERWPLSAAAPTPVLTLAALDLAPHGFTLAWVSWGATGREVARGTWLAPEDQPRARADSALIKAVTGRATKAELRAFITARGILPDPGRSDRPTTHYDLALQAHCIISRAWWPEKVTNPLPSTDGARDAPR
jgi:hypothetical protein